MKKLIIAVVAIVGAMVVNAAAVTWSATAAGTKLSDGEVANAVQAYLFEGALSQATLDSIAAGTWTASGYLYQKQTGSTGALTQANIGSYENQTVSYSMILFNAGNYAEATEFKYAEVNNIVFTTANKIANFTTPLTNASWQSISVPEPTSGLLMLLGMAGLALRRRRA